MTAPTSFTEVLAVRATTQPNDPAIHTGRFESGDVLETLTYSDVQRAVDRLAHYYSSQGLQLPKESGSPPERIIAVLTSSSVEETLLELALAKLGLTALLLSVNNSAAAVAHLCKQTEASHLIYGSAFEKIALEAKAQLGSEDVQLEVSLEKRFPLWGKGGVRDSEIEPYPARLAAAEESKRTLVILHSSGSTGFPTPVYLTHHAVIANTAMIPARTGFSALPVFHAFGHHAILAHGKALTLFPPHLPITCANIVHTITSSSSPPQQCFVVPHILELLAESQDGIKCLASFETVSSAGAAVPEDLGDRLVDAGVSLVSLFGTTETGGLMTSYRDCKTDKGWNWLRAEGPVADYLEFAPQGSDTFELIVKDGWPAKIMSNREDGAYCTKDLVERHPDHPTWYKYLGRMDDTLTQTLGEKTNPVPIELAIRGNSTLIRECIVFGDARPQVGCLILPSDQGEELSKDKEAYLKAIWPVVAQANAAAPSHSRILPEMVEILPHGTHIPIASKMSILRPACYKLFESLIDTIYDRFENGTGQPKRHITSTHVMQTFLHSTISTALSAKTSSDLTMTTDLFAYGVDSLQATRIRNDIIKSLELGDITLGQNVVYEHPSIERLAKYILDLIDGKKGVSETAQEKMMGMLEKWSDQLVNKPGLRKKEDGAKVVVLTGATGSLGAHILDQLTRRPEIKRVICLSRANSHSDSLSRIHNSLSQRLRFLTSGAQSKITSYAADLNKPNLGLTLAEFEDIRQSATSIIHNAWPVNFILSFGSFEDQIAGAVNLLNLSLTTDHDSTFYFSSSVATCLGGLGAVVAEDFSDSPSTAAMGYGQSKWVVEKLCERAALMKDAKVGVFRIGQLVGDTENGVWNETEAWPLMFKSVMTLGCLPNLEERPTWLPVDEAAMAIAEIVLSKNKENKAVYHILNDKQSRWGDVLAGLKMGGMVFDTVDKSEWVERLARSESDVEKNPTYKLLSFYQTLNERPPTEFLINRTAALSPTVSQVKEISPELVALWVGHWKKTGFLL